VAILDGDGIFLEVLPFRVRPFHLETVDGYWQRLASENFEPLESLRRHVKAIRSQSPSTSKLAAEQMAIETLGGLSRGHFRRSYAAVSPHKDGLHCGYCVTGVDARQLCRRCAGGADVTQLPHLQMVCLKHRMWTGFLPSSKDQIEIGPEVCSAERRLRRIVRSRGVDAVLVRTLRDLMLDDQKGPATDIKIFPQLVSLADRLTRPGFIKRFLAPLQSFNSKKAMLADEVTNVFSKYSPDLIDGLWTHYRPVVLSIRESCRGDAPYEPAWDHDIRVAPELLEIWRKTLGPLQSSGAYFEEVKDHQQLQDFPIDWRTVEQRVVHHRITPAYSAAHEGHTANIREGTVRTLCLAGHAGIVGHKRLIAALQAGRSMCRYCTHQYVLSGYNDLVSCALNSLHNCRMGYGECWAAEGPFGTVG
jgi:hypothetical protein